MADHRTHQPLSSTPLLALNSPEVEPDARLIKFSSHESSARTRAIEALKAVATTAESLLARLAASR